ncbi:MAG: AAA family ATPase [Francisellaceae bacterium]|nr:AAA family ATPase [Francisellaceae bacterium]
MKILEAIKWLETNKNKYPSDAGFNAACQMQIIHLQAIAGDKDLKTVDIPRELLSAFNKFYSKVNGSSTDAPEASEIAQCLEAYARYTTHAPVPHSPTSVVNGVHSPVQSPLASVSPSSSHKASAISVSGAIPKTKKKTATSGTPPPVTTGPAYTGFVDTSPGPTEDFDDQIDCVRQYLTRYAAAEQYEATGKKIGYQQHLEYLEENVKMLGNDDGKKKAQIVLDWYLKMPGFGYRADKHYHVRLHNHQKLLELELKGLRKNNAAADVIEAKEAEIKELVDNHLKPELKNRIAEIRERMAKVIKDDPENKQYVKPIVDKYISWLAKMHKGGKPGFTIMDGPPGTGKTYFGETIATVLGLDFQKAAMSSESDSSLIKGRGKGWDDPKPGRGAEFMDKAGSQAFLWFPDELEKAEKDVVNQHVDLFEDEQRTYEDEIFNKLGVPCDYIPYVATTNDMDLLPSHIRSRAQVVVMKGKTPEEKVNIMKRKFVKLLGEDVRFDGKNINYDEDLDKFLLEMLQKYSTEPGFREDNRNLEAIVGALADHFDEHFREDSVLLNMNFLERKTPPVLAAPGPQHIQMKTLRYRLSDQRELYKEKRASGGSGEDEIKDGLIAKHSIVKISEELVDLLKKELRIKPENKALLNPEIADLEKSIIPSYSSYSVEEIRYLSSNISNLSAVGIEADELYPKTEILLRRANVEIKSLKREILELQARGKHDRVAEIKPQLEQMIKEKDAIVELRSKLAAHLKIEQPKSDMMDEEEEPGLAHMIDAKARVDQDSPGDQYGFGGQSMMNFYSRGRKGAHSFVAPEHSGAGVHVDFSNNFGSSPYPPRIGMDPNILRHLEYVGKEVQAEFSTSVAGPSNKSLATAMPALSEWIQHRTSSYQNIDAPKNKHDRDKQYIAANLSSSVAENKDFNLNYGSKDSVSFKKEEDKVKVSADVSSLKNPEHGDKFIASIMEVAAKVYLETGKKQVVINGLEDSPDVAVNFLEAAAALAAQRNIKLEIKFDAPTCKAIVENRETNAQLDNIKTKFPEYADQIDNLRKNIPEVDPRAGYGRGGMSSSKV